MSNPLLNKMTNANNLGGNIETLQVLSLLNRKNPQQALLGMLQQKNPQAYQMIQQGATPEQLMQHFGITQEQINQVQQMFGNNLK